MRRFVSNISQLKSVKPQHEDVVNIVKYALVRQRLTASQLSLKSIKC